jgi:hypothetical protein
MKQQKRICNRWCMQLIVFDFEITYRIGNINSIDGLFRRPDYEKFDKEEISLSLFTLSNKFNYWRNKTNQSSSAKNISVMNINIAILIRRQAKDDACILFISRDEAARGTSAHRGSQIENPLKGFIENSSLNVLSLLR